MEKADGPVDGHKCHGQYGVVHKGEPLCSDILVFSSNKFKSHLWHRSRRFFFFSLILSALKQASKHGKRLTNKTTCRRNSSKPSAEPAHSQQLDLYQQPKILCKKKDKRKKSNWNDLDCATRPRLSLPNFDWATMMVDLAIVVIPFLYRLYPPN